MQSAYSVFKDSNKVVTTAGTRQQLSTVSVPIGKVFISANDTNTDNIVVGGPTVVALAGVTRSGNVLSPGAQQTIEIDDLSKVWLDAVVSGEGVSYSYLA